MTQMMKKPTKKKISLPFFKSKVTCVQAKNGTLQCNYSDCALTAITHLDLFPRHIRSGKEIDTSNFKHGGYAHLSFLHSDYNNECDHLFLK